MTLQEKQSRFAQLVASLLSRAVALGYTARLGEAWRSEWEATRLAKSKLGIRRSLHCDRLAIDLVLDKDGVWLKDTDAYRPLGEWWERQDPECRWGGRFTRPDGNHFSLAHGGRA